MKTSLLRVTAGLLAFLSTGCIYVRVKGDLDELRDDELSLWDDSEEHGSDHDTGYHELSAALEGCLEDPSYDLDLSATPWRTKTRWTVRYAGPGSDGHAAFHKAREALLQRIAREGGTLGAEHEDGPSAWSCSFSVDGEPGEASVRLVENADEDDERPHQLEVVWVLED